MHPTTVLRHLVLPLMHLILSAPKNGAPRHAFHLEIEENTHAKIFSFYIPAVPGNRSRLRPDDRCTRKRPDHRKPRHSDHTQQHPVTDWNPFNHIPGTDNHAASDLSWPNRNHFDHFSRSDGHQFHNFSQSERQLGDRSLSSWYGAGSTWFFHDQHDEHDQHHLQ